MENGDAVPTELKERRSTVDFGDKGLESSLYCHKVFLPKILL